MCCRVRPTVSSNASTVIRRRRPDRPSWTIKGAATDRRIVLRGFSDDCGSWKIICIFRRTGRNAASPRPTRLWPSKRMSPPVGRIKRRMARPTVDLPDPDSPTRPRHSPSCRVKLTPSTARTNPRAPPSQPAGGWKSCSRFSTSSSILMPSRLRTPPAPARRRVGTSPPARPAWPCSTRRSRPGRADPTGRLTWPLRAP